MQAENAQRFLAEAGKLLAASLDHETTTDRIARLAVPILSDWCLVDLVEDGQLRRVSVAYADPADEAFAERVKVSPSDPDTPRGLWHVIKTGQSVLVEEVDEATLRHAAR